MLNVVSGPKLALDYAFGLRFIERTTAYKHGCHELQYPYTIPTDMLTVTGLTLIMHTDSTFSQSCYLRTLIYTH